MVKKEDSKLKKTVEKVTKKVEKKELKVDTVSEDIVAEIEAPEIPEIHEVPNAEVEIKELYKLDFKSFNSGDTVKVYYKIIEGDKTRIQPYQGIVISKRGVGMSQTFMVRRVGTDGIGVERIFQFHSPNITKIEVVRKGRVRRAKLYYLREKKGRAATKVKEVRSA